MKKTACVALLITAVISALFALGCNVSKRSTYYDINFIADGKQISTVSSAGNEVIDFPFAPEKTDYRFDGWFLDDGVWQKPFAPDAYLNKALNKNINAYAKYSLKTYSTNINIAGFLKEGNMYSDEFPSGVNRFELSKIVAEDAEATVTCYYDSSLSYRITDSYFPLDEGSTQSFYVKVVNGKNNAVYTVKITRRKSVTVEFYANSLLYYTAKVDKGQVLTDIPDDPGWSYGGYFTGWDYDFNQPVNVDSLTVNAIFEVNEELAPFVYTRLGSDYYRITGLRDQSVTDVVIPDSVKEIADRAFYMNGNINSLHIGKNVQVIGQYAFYDCRKLESITADSENKYFGAESNCLIKKSNGYIILGCNNSVIPETGVNGIEEYAFYNYGNITSINIPATVSYIGTNAFGLCSGLETITVSAANTYFTSKGNCIIDKNGILVLGCKNSVIPTENVSEIGTYAFYGCTGLVSLDVPANITKINNYSFAYCRNLASMSFNANSNYYVENNCVIDKNSKTLVVGLKNAVIPADGSVTAIGECAFMGREITEIVIPASVKNILGSAFFDCKNLNTVYYEGINFFYSEVFIQLYNDCLFDANVYYYSEEYSSGDYWHYVDGVPTKW